MKWMKHLLLVVLAAVIIIVGYFSFQPKPVVVDMDTVSRGRLEVTVDEDGKTRIKEKYIVSTPVGGRLQRVELREGDAVHCNQTVLAVVQPGNPDLLDARSLAQAKAQVAAAKAAVERSEARSKQLEIELGQAKKDFDRAKKLVKSKAISSSEFEKTQASYRASSELYRSSVFDNDIANYELELAEAAMVHFESDSDDAGSAEYFSIESPIDGVVLRVLRESTTIVSPGMELMELGDDNDLEVVVDVLSTDAVKIRPGTKVYLEQWGGEERLEGIVRLIEPAAVEKISALGVEEQRVNVIVDFEQGQHELLELLGDGYRVEARMVVWQSDDVLKVPTSALFRETNQWSVFRVEDGVARLTRVDVGHRNDNEAEVVSGLNDGDTIILHPGDNLYSGSKVVSIDE